MGKVGTFGGTLFLILGVLFLIGWFGAGMGIDYIDNQLEENCDSTSGQNWTNYRLGRGTVSGWKRFKGPSFFITIFIATWWICTI